MESWGRFPRERDRLFKLIASSKVSILSYITQCYQDEPHKGTQSCISDFSFTCPCCCAFILDLLEIFLHQLLSSHAEGWCLLYKWRCSFWRNYSIWLCNWISSIWHHIKWTHSSRGESSPTIVSFHCGNLSVVDANNDESYTANMSVQVMHVWYGTILKEYLSCAFWNPTHVFFIVCETRFRFWHVVINFIYISFNEV